MKIAEKFNQSAEDKATQYWQELLRPLASRENLVITAFCVGAEWGKNQSQPTEKEQDTTDWHYQFRELSKSHVAQANLIHNLKCQLSDFLESSTKRETGTHPGRKKSKRKS